VGASRFRLVRQMMSEGILIALLGGAAGLAFAYWMSRLQSQMKLPVSVPMQLDYSLDWSAVAVQFRGSRSFCGVGFSLAPALQATQTGYRAYAQRRRRRSVAQLPALRRAQSVGAGQIAGSLMLLLITGFLVLGFSRTGSAQTAFDANKMYVLSIDPVRDGYSAEKAQALFEELPERLRRLGAVRYVALAEQPPFSILGGSGSLTTKLDVGAAAVTLKSVARDKVGAGYFAALSEPVLGGREFEERDQRIDARTDGSKGVALPMILNQSAAHGLFGDANPVGRRITEDTQSYEVIGVVRDLKSGFVTANPRR